MRLLPHLRYLCYVLRHKWWVFVAGCRLATRAPKWWQTPWWRLIIHDWTKFLPSEWFPYVDYFHGDREAIGLRDYRSATLRYGITEVAPYGLFLEDRYRIALHLHYQRNRHHWQWWVRVGKVAYYVTPPVQGGELRIPGYVHIPDGIATLAQFTVMPMPEADIREMVADWAGAGRAVKGRWRLGEWYLANRDLVQMRDETRQRVEELIRYFEGAWVK